MSSTDQPSSTNRPNDLSIAVPRILPAEEDMFTIVKMPKPSDTVLDSDAFEAVWQCIKSWDINVPEYYNGYCSANGSHVMLILEALLNAGIISCDDI